MSKVNTVLVGRPRSHTGLSLAFGSVFIAAFVGGCTVTPTPLSGQEIRARVSEDLSTAFAGQPSVTAALSLEEAIARALKYNYDNRLKQMELALASSSLDVAKWQMLPSLSVSAGYLSRDSDSGSSSRSLLTNRQSLEPSTSEDRNHNQYGAVLAWNVLDFGVSYVRAQQSANQVLVAEERRRKVIQNIMNDVRYAYWRAAGAQALVDDLQKLTERVNASLLRSRRMEEGLLMPPLQALAYQRSLMDIMQVLMARRNELLHAKHELSALINVRAGTEFTLAVPKELPKLPALPASIEKLESDALSNRPELREEDYRKRISVLETRRALLSLLPGIDLSYGSRYDSNSYLYNESWRAGSVNVSMNLLRVFQGPDVMRNAEAVSRVDDTRRVAMAVAVLTQVRLSVLRYNESVNDLNLAQSSSEIDQKVMRVVASNFKSNAESELEVVRAEARTILSRVLQYVAYANAHAAFGRVLHSAGYEELPRDAAVLDLPVLAGKVRDQLDTYYRGIHPAQMKGYGEPKIQLQVAIEPLDSEKRDVDFAEVLRKRLAASGVMVVDAKTANVPRLRGHLQISKTPGRLGQVEVAWVLHAPDGAAIQTFSLRTALADSASPGAWRALAAAASDRVVSGLIAKDSDTGQAKRSP